MEMPVNCFCASTVSLELVLRTPGHVVDRHTDHQCAVCALYHTSRQNKSERVHKDMSMITKQSVQKQEQEAAATTDTSGTFQLHAGMSLPFRCQNQEPLQAARLTCPGSMRLGVPQIYLRYISDTTRRMPSGREPMQHPTGLPSITPTSVSCPFLDKAVVALISTTEV